MTRYPVELPISFEGGAGVTRSVSREEVRFATDVPLAVEQLLTGTLRASAAGDGAGITLRYRARVVAVRRPVGPDLYEVEARFEQLGFATLHDAHRRAGDRHELAGPAVG